MPTKDYSHELDLRLERIDKDSSICDENKELIHRFVRSSKLQEQSPATIVKNLARLRPMAQWAGEKTFDEMDKADVEDLVVWIHNGAHSGQEYSEATVFTYKTVIRSFWHSMYGTDYENPPEQIAWIKLNYNYDNNTLPEDLLTQDDILKQIEAATNPRDRAFIAMLYETGARIGELIDLEVGSIEDRKHGKKVVISGKTGARRVPLVDSVPYLNKWLNAHPDPRSDAALWCKIRGSNHDEPLSWEYIRKKILKKTMNEAGIDKPSNPHHYRHSRATELAQWMTEASLCQWMGWVQGSDQPAKYVHLSGRDLDGMYDSHHGLISREEEESKSTAKQCLRCEELNEPTDKFCSNCGFELTIQAVVEKEDAQKDAESRIVHVENESEARIVQSILKDLRENPEELLGE